MSVMSKLAGVTGIAAAAVFLYAQHRGDKTGKDVGAVLSNLPEELSGTMEELRQQLHQAMEAGRVAAADKEAEIDRQLIDEAPRVMPPVPEFDI